MIKLYKLLLFLFVGTTMLIADAHTAREVAEKAVFRIINVNPTASSTGTGFVVNKKGYIVTNFHVIDGYVKDGLLVQNRFFESGRVKVIKAYPKKDLAILQIEGYDHKSYVKLQDPSTLIPSDKAFAFGYPGAADIAGEVGSEVGKIATMTEGIISRFNKTGLSSRNFPPSYHLIQTNSAINGGNSGGPLLSAIGTVMGVNTWGPKMPSQGIGWAINVKEVMTVLKENRIKFHKNKSDPTGEKTTVLTYILYGIGVLILMGVLLMLLRLSRKKEQSLDEKDLSRLIRKKMGEVEDEEGVYSSNGYEVMEDELYEVSSSTSSSSHTEMIAPSGHTAYIQSLFLKAEDNSLPLISLETGNSVVVGRSSECDIVINNEDISRRHVKITAIPGGVEVEDLGSTNGTFIGSRRLNTEEKVLLQSAEKLSIGSSAVTYVFKG